MGMEVPKKTRPVDNPQAHEGELTTGAVASSRSSDGAAERNPATEAERFCPLRLLRRNEAYSQPLL